MWTEDPLTTRIVTTSSVPIQTVSVGTADCSASGACCLREPHLQSTLHLTLHFLGSSVICLTSVKSIESSDQRTDRKGLVSYIEA